MVRTVKIVLCCLVTVLGTVAVSAAVSDDFLKVPLFEVGHLWVKASRNMFDRLKSLVLRTPDFSSPWTYVGLTVAGVILYYLYILLFVPMNRVRQLGDLGYIAESNLTMKETAEQMKRRREAGEVPPVYPNGWFGVVESRQLGKGQVVNVNVLGLNLAVFRGEDGRPHVLDAYCPHLGANLAIGGRVFGSCLECPFHGWKFRGDDGKCTHIPNVEKIPEIATVKSYPTIEMNGFVYMWHHAEHVEPYWTPPEIEEISKGNWTYRGRTEHMVNAHIEEVPENGADVAHLAQVHTPIMTAGVDLRYMYSWWWEFGKHLWQGTWHQDKEQKHIGQLNLTHTFKIFGIHIPILDMEVVARQIGPGIVYLTFDSVFGKGAYLQSLTPAEPLVQRMVHHVYFAWHVPMVIGKFFLLGEAMMVERDIMIWNNKKYVNKPVFTRSKEDALLLQHRRWYSQFYSEHSPRLKVQKQESIDW